jgi:ubiquinol-cytochrome c reductase cytochrome b subunit
VSPFRQAFCYRQDKPGELLTEPSLLKRLDTWIPLSRLTYRIPAHGRSLFCSLGGIVFFGFLLMIATGVILLQFYNPLPDQAYESLETIQSIGFLSYIRALHYWISQGVLIALIVHLSRVFIVGAYKTPRQVTWWLGVALFATMLMGSYFSGTVLKWDEEGADALAHYQQSLRFLGPLGAIMTDSLPGSSSMNLRIFASHITVFPILIIVLLIGHFLLIRTFNLSPTPWDKWSNQPQIPKEEMKGRFNEHGKTILIFSLLYYGFLAVVALFARAPLGPAPSASHDPLKPPWPFLWMYGFENVWGVVAVLFASGALFGFLALIPLIDRKQDRSFAARKKILTLGGVVAFLVLALTLHGWITPAQEHTHGHGEAAHEDDGHAHDEEEEEHGHDEMGGDPAHDEEEEHSHDEEEGSDHSDDEWDGF